MEFKLKNITIDTKDNKNVVKDVNFSVSSGEIHILMGANGSGKSSLLNGIFGHPDYKISNGEILFDKKNITKLATEEKARLGLFLSMQHLPEIAGVTLASFMFKSYKVIYGDKDMNIFDFKKKMEDIAKDLDIDTKFLERELHVGFSGGEKKQSEILQLLILSPKFAFLDEIDSGVDVDALKKVFKGINMLREQGTGFVLVTHSTEILDKVTPDAVHVMENGELVISGKSDLIEKIKKDGFKGIKN